MSSVSSPGMLRGPRAQPVHGEGIDRHASGETIQEASPGGIDLIGIASPHQQATPKDDRTVGNSGNQVAMLRSQGSQRLSRSGEDAETAIKAPARAASGLPSCSCMASSAALVKVRLSGGRLAVSMSRWTRQPKRPLQTESSTTTVLRASSIGAASLTAI